MHIRGTDTKVPHGRQMTAKIIMKRALSDILELLRLHTLTEVVSFSHAALVLMYHRVLPQELENGYLIQPGMYVTVDSFKHHLQFLSSNFNLIFLEDLIEGIRDGKMISRSCAITFDDGWRDNFNYAFPLLQTHAIPATIFLATGFISSQERFWPDELSLYLTSYNKELLDSETIQSPPNFLREEISCIKKINQQSLDAVIEHCKTLSPSERHAILSHLHKTFKPPAAPRLTLTWDEVKKMSSSGLVRFGSHTVNHEMLDQLSPEKAREEVIVSREIIEQQVGRRIGAFSYPNGNFNKTIRDTIIKSGYTLAVTTRKGLMTNRNDPFEIPRVSIHEDVGKPISVFRSHILFPRF